MSSSGPSSRPLSLDEARNHWVRATGLADPVEGTLESLVESTGWARTLGGVDAYLALRARRPGLHRETVDQAVEDGSLLVSPAARNCNYVIPGSQRPWVLAEAEAIWAGTAPAQHGRAGLAEGEVSHTAEAVMETLTSPMTTAEIRASLPEGVIRSLGDAGKKAGISSSLPPALRLLEFRDRIRRRTDGSRIDTEKYRWAPVESPDPFSGSEEERRALLAHSFATFCGPFTVAELASFAGIGRRDALAAIEAGELATVNVEALGEAYMLPERADSIQDGEPIEETAVRLLGFEDSALVAHSPSAWFDPRHHSREMPVWGRGDHTLGGASHLFMRTILCGNRMSGFWAWNPDEHRVEVAVLDKPTKSVKEALLGEVEAVSEFLNSEFGNARMTSIDSESTERARLDALRSLK